MLFDPAAHRALRRQAGTARSPWFHLLAAVLELAGGHGELLRHSEQPWASATFSGTRHTLLLQFRGADGLSAGEALIAALPDHEFTLPRQIVADAAVIAAEHTTLPTPRLTIEIALLLLDES
ncbi:MAG: hypothetical protein RIQ99_1337 [Pseudomonadota bacterium]|jgi:hypothetical protein